MWAACRPCAVLPALTAATTPRCGRAVVVGCADDDGATNDVDGLMRLERLVALLVGAALMGVVFGLVAVIVALTVAALL